MSSANVLQRQYKSLHFNWKDDELIWTQISEPNKVDIHAFTFMCLFIDMYNSLHMHYALTKVNKFLVCMCLSLSSPFSSFRMSTSFIIITSFNATALLYLCPEQSYNSVFLTHGSCQVFNCISLSFSLAIWELE